MFKLALGSFAAAVAMFITGFVFFATPIGMIAYTTASEAQTAAVQTALAANLPKTGTYMVPDPSTQSGTTLYGKGPVAMVHYNSNGFPVADPSAILNGFIQELIVCLIIAGALYGIASRVTDFASRAQLVVLFSVATTGLLTLGNPIWLHQDWAYNIYGLVANTVMLSVAGLVIARWFLPSAAQQPQESAGS
ncbi:MAG: hypothetical protein IPN48_12590 [Sphingomonadales bacterium]|nr:hypothetical protein [Sphingomonadales bacterium]